MISITFYISKHHVLPRVTSDKPILQAISLSRKGIGCRYVPSDFRQHDGHAPKLTTTQEEQDYINRVTKDILKAWKEANKKEVKPNEMPKL